MNRDDWNVALSGLITDAGLPPEDSDKLVQLALCEIACALDDGAADGASGIASVCAAALPQGLGEAVRLVRRAEEMPLYIAKVTALWYKGKGVGAEDVKEAVARDLGLGYEREFLQLVWEAMVALPDLGLDEKSLAKSELMKKAHRIGYAYERDYRGCAQCTIAAVSCMTGRENPALFRAASGFAAGMSQMGDGACGGYSGGMLAMGLFAGRRIEFFDGDKEEKELINLMSRRLHKKFIETYGTVVCHGIHNEIFGRAFHITLPEDKDAFEEAGAHLSDKCTSVVGAATAWTVEILLEFGFIDDLGCVALREGDKSI